MIGWITSKIAGALLWKICGGAIIAAGVSIAGCTIYNKIGKDAVNKAVIKGNEIKVEQRKDDIKTAKKKKKEYIKKKAKYPDSGPGLTPEQKLENSAKRFQ